MGRWVFGEVEGREVRVSRWVFGEGSQTSAVAETTLRDRERGWE